MIDPAMCQPRSSVTYDPAYSYRCDGSDLECTEGEILQPPRETRSRLTGAAEVGPWRALSSWQCVTPEEGDLIDNVRRAFARMTITPPPVTVIDGRGWTFVQIDTVIYSDAEPQTLNDRGRHPVEPARDARRVALGLRRQHQSPGPPPRPAAPTQTRASPTSTPTRHLPGHAHHQLG